MNVSVNPPYNTQERVCPKSLSVRPACIRNNQDIELDTRIGAAEGQKTLISFLKDKMCQRRHIWRSPQVMLHVTQSLPKLSPGVGLTFTWVVMSSFTTISQTWKASVASGPFLCYNVMWDAAFSVIFYTIVVLQLVACSGCAGVKQTKGTKEGPLLSFTSHGRSGVCVSSGTRQAGSVWHRRLGGWGLTSLQTAFSPRRITSSGTADMLQGWFEEHNLQIPQIPRQLNIRQQIVD